jgi:hypothetical protein
MKKMKKTCCNIYHCKNFPEILNCVTCDLKLCCGKVELYAQDASKTCYEKTIIKISENIYNKTLEKIKCDICRETNDDVCNFEIISCILIGNFFYIFLQMLNNHKKNILSVIQGEITNINNENIAIDNSIKNQMNYNLYNSAKNSCLDKHIAKRLKIVQILYNKYDDLFVILLKSCGFTLLAKIEHLEAIHSIGTNIDFIFTHKCDLLLINGIPLCICPVEKEKRKYNLTVFDECDKCNKTHILCF